MQFYLISPLFIAIYIKRPIFGALLALFLGLFSSSYLGLKTLQYGYSPHTFDGYNVTLYSFHVYTKPQFRITPYCIGMFIAMVWLYKSKYYPMYKYPLIITNIALIKASFILLYLIFGSISAYQKRPCGYMEPISHLCGSNWTNKSLAIYNTFSKLGWSISLGIITLILGNQQGIYMNRFLSQPLFFFFSKLTFALYLIHVIVLNIWTFSKTQKYRYSHFEFFMDYFGIVFVSSIVALLVTVFIEKPSSTLVKLIEKMAVN